MPLPPTLHPAHEQSDDDYSPATARPPTQKHVVSTAAATKAPTPNDDDGARGGTNARESLANDMLHTGDAAQLPQNPPSAILFGGACLLLLCLFGYRRMQQKRVRAPGGAPPACPAAICSQRGCLESLSLLLLTQMFCCVLSVSSQEEAASQPRELALPTFDSFAMEGEEFDFDDGGGGAESADLDISVDGDFEMGEVGDSEAVQQRLNAASEITFDLNSDTGGHGSQPGGVMDKVS